MYAVYGVAASNDRMDVFTRRIVCITGPTSAPANGSVVVTIDNHPAVAPFTYKVRLRACSQLMN